VTYIYKTEKPRIFTEDGQVMFLKIRDHTKELFHLAGVAKASHMTATVPGDSWAMLACIDRLVELGEIREIMQPHFVAGQDRIFVKA